MKFIAKYLSRLFQPSVYSSRFHRPSQEEKKELDEITAKRQKKGRNEEEAPAEEKTVLHGTIVAQ